MLIFDLVELLAKKNKEAFDRFQTQTRLIKF